ncbi:MAG: stage III sporulation protein AF [Eubacteriales bacterium]|nr:stage III sporulation protein AF [Eubacteriales bacterium]
MTELFRTILFRVTLAGIASAAALRVVGGGALREIVKLAAGLLMLLALLQPLGRLRLPAWTGILDTSRAQTAEIEEQNNRTAQSSVANSIAGTLEKRAAQQGIDCTVTVAMATDGQGVLQIDRVTVYHAKQDAALLDELQTLIMDECGVPKDRQELIER